MLAHTQGFGVRQTNSNSSSTADYLGKVNLFSQHKFIQRLFSPRCRPVQRDLTPLRLCFSYLDNGYNYMHWSSRYSEGTAGLLYGYHCTGSPQMLILPLLPQSHLLVSVQAFRSSCQGHCSSWLVAHETGPVGAKPCCYWPCWSKAPRTATVLRHLLPPRPALPLPETPCPHLERGLEE